MVRFSCFPAHANKPKKIVEPSVEAMQKTLQDRSEKGDAVKDLKVQGGGILSDGGNHITGSSSVDCGFNSEKINFKYDESEVGAHWNRQIRKSISLGSGLDRKGKVSGDHESEDEIDQGFSFDGSHGDKDPEISPPSPYQEALPFDSLHVSANFANNESIFLIGDAQQSDKGGRENSDTGESSNHVLRKSSSLPNLSSFAGPSGFTDLAPRSRSFEDLYTLNLRQKYDCSLNTEKTKCEKPRDYHDSYKYVGPAKDWIITMMDEASTVKKLNGESSASQSDYLPSEDLKIKRIEEWVIDLQHCDPLEETNELSDTNDHRSEKVATKLDYLSTAKLDVKVTPGMEAVKKYLSSLSATATTAQLANHGLAVIPFLSAFVSLRALNLSGNAIVRITAGALPRGLHMLNLSKNNISTIEGLRELTRLRVLDLSYNRIIRIGHGLASCSSLKELYLAGNKISEVEGLHRLLKLNVLDLRFNKISTAKCLGQLAANYNSLQAITLEGNPAQKNVGDEQLKKYLQGLLPHLSYFNRLSIKSGALKDSADRSARLGIGAHQIDRGLRSDHKALRKGSHSIVAPHKTSSSSNHGRKGQSVVSPKQSRARHVRLPPTGTKTPSSLHRHHFHDSIGKLPSFGPELSMRRSRSEGTLAAAI